MDETEHTNLDTIYDYTKNYVASVSASWKEMNVRTATVAGLSALLLKAAVDIDIIPIKFGVCSCIVLVLILCGVSYWSSDTGSLMEPEVLLNEFYYVTDERCRLQILENWNLTVKDTNRRLNRKAFCVNVSIIVLFLGFLLSVVGVVASSYKTGDLKHNNVPERAAPPPKPLWLLFGTLIERKSPGY